MFERARRRRAERRELERLAAGGVRTRPLVFAEDTPPMPDVPDAPGFYGMIAQRDDLDLSAAGRVALLAARSAIGGGRAVGPSTAAVLVAELERLAERDEPSDRPTPGHEPREIIARGIAQPWSDYDRQAGSIIGDLRAAGYEIIPHLPEEAE